MLVLSPPPAPSSPVRFCSLSVTPKFIHFFQAAISQLQEQHSLLKLLTHSLITCHKKVTSDIPSQSLSGDTLIDNMYTYAETVVTHLKLIEFLLQDGGLYLSWSRCKDIWDCLMLDNQNCEGDYEVNDVAFCDIKTNLL